MQSCVSACEFYLRRAEAVEARAGEPVREDDPHARRLPRHAALVVGEVATVAEPHPRRRHRGGPSPPRSTPSPAPPPAGTASSPPTTSTPAAPPLRRRHFAPRHAPTPAASRHVR